MEIVHAAGDNFGTLISQEKPTLVDFFATWCGPCKMLSPILEVVAAEREATLTFAKLNIDEASDIAEAWGIVAVPTLMLFKDGRMLSKLVGYREKEDILAWIDETV